MLERTFMAVSAFCPVGTVPEAATSLKEDGEAASLEGVDPAPAADSVAEPGREPIRRLESEAEAGEGTSDCFSSLAAAAASSTSMSPPEEEDDDSNSVWSLVEDS